MAARAPSVSSAHRKGERSTQSESEGVWHAWTVSFETDAGPIEQLFAFLDVDGRYLLGDID